MRVTSLKQGALVDWGEGGVGRQKGHHDGKARLTQTRITCAASPGLPEQRVANWVV